MGASNYKSKIFFLKRLSKLTLHSYTWNQAHVIACSTEMADSMEKIDMILSPPPPS